jgi:hypothetical protein
VGSEGRTDPARRANGLLASFGSFVRGQLELVERRLSRARVDALERDGFIRSRRPHEREVREVIASRVIATPDAENGAAGNGAVTLHFVEGHELAYEANGALRAEPDAEVCVVLDRAMVVRTIRALYQACRPEDGETRKALRVYRVLSPSGPSDLMAWDDCVTVLDHVERSAGAGAKGVNGASVRIVREEKDDGGKVWLVDVPRPV